MSELDPFVPGIQLAFSILISLLTVLSAVWWANTSLELALRRRRDYVGVPRRHTMMEDNDGTHKNMHDYEYERPQLQKAKYLV